MAGLPAVAVWQQDMQVTIPLVAIAVLIVTAAVTGSMQTAAGVLSTAMAA